MAKPPLRIDTLTHDEASRKNAPTAELEAFVPPDMKTPIQAAYARRNPDLDPQLVWRGKDMADWSDLIVNAPPLYIQEKIHPKAILESLKRYASSPERGGGPRSGGGAGPSAEQIDLFADFNGIEPDQRTEFYAHDQHWSNRMILGDGLQVMASLAEREGLKGQVQCIYIDPPYGIKFNSNFQWSTTSRDVKDGKADHLTREPEQVKAFRDTWADGIHSYLTYLRDRLTVARDLLSESGSVFVQIGDENVHRVRALMDEVFGDENFVSEIVVMKTAGRSAQYLANVSDMILWFAKDAQKLKYRKPLTDKGLADDNAGVYRWLEKPDGERQRMSDNDLASYQTGQGKIFRLDNFTSQKPPGDFPIDLFGQTLKPGKRYWSTGPTGAERLKKANRLVPSGFSAAYIRYLDDFPAKELGNVWTDTGTGSFTDEKFYVVQTGTKTVQRCILMATDPGDLVLDPTCGSGTTAYVAEQWGRRWITMDTSRVALALARARIMGARYPWYLLADSAEGVAKEAEVTRTIRPDVKTHGRLRQGFVYKRAARIMLGHIANNAEIDTIWAGYQDRLEPLRAALNDATSSPERGGGPLAKQGVEGRTLSPDAGREDRDEEAHPAPGAPGDGPRPSTTGFAGGPPPPDGGGLEEWQIPRDAPADWSDAAKALHAQWWSLRIARQREIDASIAAKADTEYLYDQPYEDKARVRVAGPFTVESLSPHRVAAIDSDDTLFDELEASQGRYKGAGRAGEPAGDSSGFAEMVLENLRKSGVQQAHKADRLVFSTLKLWPGRFLCAEGTVRQASEGESDTLADSPTRRAAILVGPEYGTISRADLTAAAREAMEAGFELLIAAAFNFDAHASEFEKMGALTVLKARINPDLHMPDLANTGAGNLFTVFGEPDIIVHEEAGGLISIEVAGIDMYKGGQIESSSADDIAVWFIDTDYNYESFFVRHAYFPGANDPYKALKTTLKAEIDAEAWESLKKIRSRPFARPASGTVAVKVVNHLGDEVMKVMAV